MRRAPGPKAPRPICLDRAVISSVRATTTRPVGAREDVRSEWRESGLCGVANVALAIESGGFLGHAEDVLHRAQPAVVVVGDVADGARPDEWADQHGAGVAPTGGGVGRVK